MEKPDEKKGKNPLLLFLEKINDLLFLCGSI